MANPIDTLKKIKGKSWTEIRTRGEQAISGYTEQMGLSGKLPSDEEFAQLIEKSHFGSEDATSGKSCSPNFVKTRSSDFFPPFVKKKKLSKLFGTVFGEKSAQFFYRKS